MPKNLAYNESLESVETKSQVATESPTRSLLERHDELLNLVQDYRSLTQQETALAKQKKPIRDILETLVRTLPGKSLQLNQFTVKIQEQEAVDFDLQSFKHSHPDLYAKFLKIVIKTRFSVS